VRFNADCDGINFVGLAEGSEWEVEPTDDGTGLQKRILSCPAGVVLKMSSANLCTKRVGGANMRAHAGYELRREQASPDQDDCLRCTQGFYRLKPVKWQGPDATLPPCFQCPKGATCPGGNSVEAEEGFWRLQTEISRVEDRDFEYLTTASDVCEAADAQEGIECLFPAGSHLLKAWNDEPMFCTHLPEVSDSLVCARLAPFTSNSSSLRRAKGASKTSGTTDGSVERNESFVDDGTAEFVGSARIYPCVLGACDSNNTCNQDRVGPLCGMCSPGYSMTTEGCSAAICPPEEELRPWRILSMAVGGILVLLLWWAFCWRPVAPEVDWLIASVLQGVLTIMSSFMCFSNTQGDGADVAGGCSDLLSTFWDVIAWIMDKLKAANAFWQENNGGQFVKIYVTFIQILSSFTMFTIQWPAEFTAAINWAQGTFKFDVVKLPMMSCLWNGIEFETTLRTYTLGPLILIGMLLMPIVVARFRRLHVDARGRYRETVDRFWTNSMFAAFALYPALAMTSMSVIPTFKSLHASSPILCMPQSYRDVHLTRTGYQVLNCDPNVGRLRDDYRGLFSSTVPSLSSPPTCTLPFSLRQLLQLARTLRLDDLLIPFLFLCRPCDLT